jgi:hypothetical protein
LDLDSDLDLDLGLDLDPGLKSRTFIPPDVAAFRSLNKGFAAGRNSKDAEPHPVLVGGVGNPYTYGSVSGLGLGAASGVRDLFTGCGGLPI